jgi:hypothetical protein
MVKVTSGTEGENGMEWRIARWEAELEGGTE